MIIARRTESVNEGVILNAVVNCSHMLPVNLTPNLLTSRYSKLTIYFIMRRVCNNFSTTRTLQYIGLPDQLKYNCNAFMLQYRLNSTFQNVSIDIIYRVL